MANHQNHQNLGLDGLQQNLGGGGHGALPSTRPSQPAPPPLSSYHVLQYPDSLRLHLPPTSAKPCFESMPITALLGELSSKARRIIVINDSMMAYVVQDVVTIPNAESFTFQSVSAFACFLYSWETMGKTLETNDNVIPNDLPSLEDCFTTEFLDSFATQYDFQNLNSGCLYNTCRILDGSYMDLMEKLEDDKKHWAIGPFNPVRNIAENKTSSNGSRHKCLQWLDKEAPNSVIYVSFGTTTAMEDKQIEELAIGLEQIEQKFIWVLRDADRGDVFINGEQRKVEFLKGFEERVIDKGLVVRDWAPQLEILSHPSTGAFYESLWMEFLHGEYHHGSANSSVANGLGPAEEHTSVDNKFAQCWYCCEGLVSKRSACDIINCRKCL
uniref:Glycosyltransferase N-terminal domain-containing protein n=1 Tax=Fagus sylvatica TaxID=28930 RepID=A0A2N9FH43_FAGSY